MLVSVSTARFKVTITVWSTDSTIISQHIKQQDKLVNQPCHFSQINKNVHETNDKPRILNSGAPQGCVLLPLLFTRSMRMTQP